MDLPIIKESLRQAALDTYFDEYKELAQAWRNLDGKAQGAIAVAGIFIAGSFAYLRDLNQNTRVYERAFLGMAILFLIICIILSVLVLRTRKVRPLPLGKFVTHYARALVEVENEADFQAYLKEFFNAHTEKWLTVISRMEEVNRLKARYLWFAQFFLMAAILTVACLSILQIVFRQS